MTQRTRQIKPEDVEKIVNDNLLQDETKNKEINTEEITSTDNTPVYNLDEIKKQIKNEFLEELKNDPSILGIINKQIDNENNITKKKKKENDIILVKLYKGEPVIWFSSCFVGDKTNTKGAGINFISIRTKSMEKPIDIEYCYDQDSPGSKKTNFMEMPSVQIETTNKRIQEIEVLDQRRPKIEQVIEGKPTGRFVENITTYIETEYDFVYNNENYTISSKYLPIY